MKASWCLVLQTLISECMRLTPSFIFDLTNKISGPMVECTNGIPRQRPEAQLLEEQGALLE